MQRIKLFGTAVMAILALTAVMASTATAKPEFLDNVKGNTFSGSGKAGALEVLGGGLSIACKENTISGEVTSNEEGFIKDIDFKGCTALGFNANSLGDAAGTILTGKIPFKLCYINEAKKEVGIYLEKISVHIEVPLVLILVTGSIIGKVTQANINSLKTGPYTITFAQSAAGDQTPVKCTLLGKELKALLLSSKNGGTAVSSSIVQVDEITFAKDIEIMA